MSIDVLPLVHPRQAGRLGASSKHWHETHQHWMASEPYDLIEGAFDVKRDYIMAVPCASGTTILAKIVTWPEPHMPDSHWEVAQELGPDVSQDEIEAAIQRVLEDSRFFGVCSYCGERCPQGCMHSETCCQSCAEKHLGVQY
jgi:hypothetical protein